MLHYTSLPHIVLVNSHLTVKPKLKGLHAQFNGFCWQRLTHLGEKVLQNVGLVADRCYILPFCVKIEPQKNNT